MDKQNKKRATAGKIVAAVNVALNGAGIAAALQGALPPKYAFAGLLAGILLQSVAPSVLAQRNNSTE